MSKLTGKSLNRLNCQNGLCSTNKYCKTGVGERTLLSETLIFQDLPKYKTCLNPLNKSKQTNTCSKSAKETLEKDAEYFQS